MSGLRDRWNQLDGKTRTYLMWAGVGVGLIALIMIVKPAPDKTAAAPNKPMDVTLFQVGSQEVDMESLNIRLQKIERFAENSQTWVSQTNEQLDQIRAMLNSDDRLQTTPEILYELQRKNSEWDARLAKMEDKLEENQNQQLVMMQAVNRPDPVAVIDDTPVMIDDSASNNPEELDVKPKEDNKDELDHFLDDTEKVEQVDSYTSLPTDPLEMLKASQKRAAANAQSGGEEENQYIKDDSDQISPRSMRKNAADGTTQRQPGQISIVQSATPVEEKVEDTGPKFIGKRINAGSNIPLTLISGVDAPTGKNGAESLTATFAVTGDVTLPDGSQMSLNGCNVLTQTTATKTEGRVYFRPYKLSCKFDFGDVDMPIQGSISGPDGALGIKGHVVNIAGKALGYATAAALTDIAASGIDESSGGITIGSDGATLVTADSGTTITAPLKEYYIDEAKELQPYVQVRPLIPANMSVLDTFQLELLEDAKKGSSKKSAKKNGR
jgi:hypothetical protein